MELFLGVLTVLAMFAILFSIITKQAEQIRRQIRENLRLEFHKRQLADALQDCADRLEVFIESDWADEQDQEAYDSARHLLSLVKQQEEAQS